MKDLNVILQTSSKDIISMYKSENGVPEYFLVLSYKDKDGRFKFKTKEKLDDAFNLVCSEVNFKKVYNSKLALTDKSILKVDMCKMNDSTRKYFVLATHGGRGEAHFPDEKIYKELYDFYLSSTVSHIYFLKQSGRIEKYETTDSVLFDCKIKAVHNTGGEVVSTYTETISKLDDYRGHKTTINTTYYNLMYKLPVNRESLRKKEWLYW